MTTPGSAFGQKIARYRAEQAAQPTQPAGGDWWRANEGKKAGCNDKSIRTPCKKVLRPRDPYGM